MEEKFGTEVDSQWIEIQKKTFTRWANTYLKERMLNITNLESDLSTGLMLINLLEIISSKSVGKYNAKPMIRAQKLENCLTALNFLKSEKIKLVNIGNDDIVDCNLKLILGLIWTIILRYQINIQEGKSARSDLLKWVQKQIPEYNIVGFTKDWNDGKAICALANSLKPGICPNHRELNPENALSNATLGTDVAERELEIPKVLAPEDMINPAVDELSVMTYISYYRDWEANQLKKRASEEQEFTPLAGRCKAYGPGLEKAETGLGTNFTIEAINVNMRRVPRGGHPFLVAISTPKGVSVPSTMKDQGNGLYDIEYTPLSETGVYTVAITLEGKHISNSPFHPMIVRGGGDPLFCKAYGPGLESATVGQLAPFTIESFNKNGVRVGDGGDPFVVGVVGPYGPIESNIVDNKNGTYAASYMPLDVGDLEVSVKLHGTHIPKSPFRLQSQLSDTDVDPLQCLVYGSGVEGAGAKTGELMTFTVELISKNGNRVTNMGHRIGVDVMSEPQMILLNNVTIKDNRDGTLSVSYVGAEATRYRIDVMLRHATVPLYYHHVAKSPYSISFQPGTDANQSIAFGPGLKDGVSDTIPTHFTIQAKDKDGKNMSEGGDPFKVEIKGPKGNVPCEVKDNNDGTYKVDYQAKDPGPHQIFVSLKDSPIKDAPFKVDVKAGADDHHSSIDSFSFVIQLRTKNGEKKKEGKEDVKVTINGPSGAVPGVNLRDVGDGTYICTYSLQNAGDYTVSVTLNGKDIKGSPWKQTF